MYRGISFLLLMMTCVMALNAQQAVTDTLPNDTLLKEISVKGRIPGVVIKGDTLIFNAEAYRLQEGSVLGDLMRRLPGVDVDEEGRIKVKGRPVSQVKINGKDFFGGNQDMAMQHLPSALVKRVKAYEEEGREQRHTGIKGREKPLIVDVELRSELKNQLTAEAMGGASVADKRYDANLFGNAFSDRWNVTLTGKSSNTDEGELLNDAGGKTATRQTAFNMNWSNTEKEDVAGKIDIDFSTEWQRNDHDTRTEWTGETYLPEMASANSGRQSSRSKDNDWNSNLTLSWYPSRRTWLSAHAIVDNNSNRGLVTGNNATFHPTANNFSIINSDDNAEKVRLKEERYNFGLFASHKIDSLGSTAFVWTDYQGGHSADHDFTINRMHYYLLSDSLVFRNRYHHTPSSPHTLTLRTGYSHHFSQLFSADVSYEWHNAYNDQQRQCYALDSLYGIDADNCPPLGWLPASADSMAFIRMAHLSQNSSHRQTINSLALGGHWEKGKLMLRTECRIFAQHTRLNFEQGSFNTRPSRTVTGVNPSAHAQWKFSPTHQLTLTYNGMSSPPSMTDLIDLPDESNPLHITTGNPNLKNTWRNHVSLWWNHYDEKHQRNLSITPSFSHAINEVAYRMEYDPVSGIQHTRPDNVNGCWTAHVNGNWSQPLTRKGTWTLNATVDDNYQHQVSFISNGQDPGIRNALGALTLSQSVHVQFRASEQWDLGLKGRYAYSHLSTSSQQWSDNTYHLSIVQGDATWHAPWQMEVGTECALRMRRGYQESHMNTTEWLWNASLSQRLLSNRSLSLGLRLTDILHQRRCIMRTFTPTEKQEVITNRIGSYALFFLRWRLNQSNL